MNRLITAEQQQIVSRLETTFGIDGDRILFLNEKDKNDPWIPPSLLEMIARQIEGYKSSDVRHDKFIPQTEQHIFTATVIDAQGREFTRSGVATVGETPTGNSDFDIMSLAAGRALSAALTAAGFHPCKIDFRRERESEMNLNFAGNYENQKVAEDAKRRQKQLGVIHELAKKKGLILKREDGGFDLVRYQDELSEHFGSPTSVNFNETERIAVINWLENYENNKPNYAQPLQQEHSEMTV